MNIKSAEERLKEYQPLWENWVIDSQIHNGVNSRVYKIKRNRDGNDEYAALKVITITLDNDMFMSESESMRYLEDRCARAKTEINNMIKLQRCSYIVSYYDDVVKTIIDADGNKAGYDILIRMEYLECFGTKVRKSSSGILQQDIINLAYDIGYALRDIHRYSMIHRDIKPDNIFIDEYGYYKLGDLGVSKTINDTGYTSTRTGTEPYAAPEVWRNEGSADNSYTFKADMYSFGIVLYQLLNNNMLPFMTDFTRNEIEKSVMMRMRGEKIAPPANGNEKLKEIICKMCEYDPQDRYKNMNEFLKELADAGERMDFEDAQEAKFELGEGISQDLIPTVDANEGYEYTVPEEIQSDEDREAVLQAEMEKYEDVEELFVTAHPHIDVSESTASVQSPDVPEETSQTAVLEDMVSENPDVSVTLFENPDECSADEPIIENTADDIPGEMYEENVQEKATEYTQQQFVTKMRADVPAESSSKEFSDTPRTQQSIDDVFYTIPPKREDDVFSTLPPGMVQNKVDISAVEEKVQVVTTYEPVLDISEDSKGNNADKNNRKQIRISEDGVFRKENYRIVRVRNGVLDIPSGYRVIDFFTLYGIERALIEHINIPATVTQICDGAFKDLTNLKTLNIEANIMTLKSRIFSGCINLEKIVVPHSVRRIEDFAFEGCQKLKTIEIKGNISGLGKNAFTGCGDITIKCLENSFIHKYCVKYNIKTEIIN